MATINVPPPDELRQRIASCELELKSLRRMLRLSQAAEQASEARQAREGAPSDRKEACDA